jgi:hypothetical protein
VEPCLLVIELWETVAARSETRVVAAAARLADGAPLADLSDRVFGLLPSTLIDDALEANVLNVGRALQTIDELLFRRREVELAELRERNERLLERRRSSLEAQGRARLARIEHDLETISEPRILRMRTAERNRVIAELEMQVAALRAGQDVDIVTRRIAMATLRSSDA